MIDLRRFLETRLPGTLAVGRALGWAVGELTSAELATIPCDVTREGEERRVPAGSGTASRKVRCEANTSGTYAWREVGAAALATADHTHTATPPTGSVIAFAGSSAPTGYLLCDGSAVSRTTYADLFDVIGTTYGAGDGSTTFNVPDLRSRFPLGFDAGQAANDTLGETGGARDVTLTAAQSGVPAHNHAAGTLAGSFTAYNNTTSGSFVPANLRNTNGGSVAVTITGSTANNTAANATESHTNMPPYLTLNFVIKS